jgi:hypothetical protein
VLRIVGSEEKLLAINPNCAEWLKGGEAADGRVRQLEAAAHALRVRRNALTTKRCKGQATRSANGHSRARSGRDRKAARMCGKLTVQ